MSSTSIKEDNEFFAKCKNNNITFAEIMIYLRMCNTQDFRREIIRIDIHPSLRKKVEIQALLERLI